MSKHVSKPVDMSLPPEQRRRRRPGRVVVTPPALMAHGTSPRARSRRRDGERWLAAEERARIGALLREVPAGNSDTGNSTGYGSGDD